MVASRTRSAALAVVTLLVSLVSTTGPAEAAGARAPHDGRPPEIEVEITKLIGPNGTRLHHPTKVNNRGQVLVGLYVATPDPGEPQYTEVVWDDGAITRVGPKERRVVLFDISDRGHVAGVIAGPDCPYDWVTFRWRRGDLTELECGGWWGAYPWTVNERGDILGLDAAWRPVVWHVDGRVSVAPDSGDAQIVAHDINDHGVAPLENLQSRRSALWHVGHDELTDLGDFGGHWTAAYDINEAGHVLGVSERADGDARAFLWRDDEMIDLGRLGVPGERWISATAVNDRDQVIGEATTESGEVHAFLWQRGRMTELGTLGGTETEVVDINNRGQVIGHSKTTDGEQHAFVWQDGRMVDLTPPSPQGSSSSRVTDINDRGQIVGQVVTEDAATAVMWTVR